MQPSSGLATLAALLQEQQALAERIHGLAPCAEDALVVGGALLAFAVRESTAFGAVAPLLDPAARQELLTEHQQIADDLALLDWLVHTTPDSPDVAELTASLLRRMRQHVDRDGRLLARAERLRL